MKKRLGFVSNSSSSSFIVIGGNVKIPQISLDNGILRIPQTFGGEIEFGWLVDDHTDIGSKINFAYMQAEYTNNLYYKTMLDDVLKDNLEVDEIENNISNDWNDIFYGYIDHQSAGYEEKNLEMFESEESLKLFIFGSESLIHTDNDNH